MTSSSLLRAASRLSTRSTTARSFSVSAAARRDFVQDLYIKELKAYKAPPQAKDAHVGAVKEFSEPKKPSPPKITSDLASELSAYDTAEPSSGVQASSARQTSDVSELSGGAKDFLETLQADLPPKEAAHH